MIPRWRIATPAILGGALIVGAIGAVYGSDALDLGPGVSPAPSVAGSAEAPDSSGSPDTGAPTSGDGSSAVQSDTDTPQTSDAEHRGEERGTVPDGAPQALASSDVDPDEWMSQIGEPGRTFLGVSTPTDTDEEIAAFGEAAGRKPDVVMFSRDFASGGFDLATVERLATGGYFPLITWEPWDHDDVVNGERLRAVQPAYTLRSIAAGVHDEVILDWAQGAAAWERPIGMRFAHEMNGHWYPWAEAANGNGDGDYVAAWRHVHGLFEDAGADNVIWIWSPNLIQGGSTDLDVLWPGEDYVDLIGLVGYLGNGIDPAVWTPTFDELFSPTIEEIRRFSDLPFVITEIGATESGGRKADWIAEVLDAIGESEDIVGMIWFEIDKEVDWRIVSSPEATAAFSTGVADDDLWGLPRDGRSTSELISEPAG